MKIDLSIITKSINKELTQEADISLTSFRSRLGDFPIVRKAPVTLQIRNEENAAVFVKGTVDIDVMIPCARCLEEVRTVFDGGTVVSDGCSEEFGFSFCHPFPK